MKYNGVTIFSGKIVVFRGTPPAAAWVRPLKDLISKGKTSMAWIWL